MLSDVVPGGPAATAGLQPGDVVIALDGKRLENGRQFRINIYTRGMNETVTLDVQRGERRLSVRVPVAERSGGIGSLAELIAQQSPVRALGIMALSLTPPVAQALEGLRRDKGVVVLNVSAGTPFSQQGRLQPGDVIYALNGKPVGAVEDLNAVAATLKPGSAAVLHLERGGTLMFLSFRVERN